MFEFLSKNRKLNAAAHELFSQVIEQSRVPDFYTDFEVSDNLDGRFDLLALHMALLLYKLEQHVKTPGTVKLKRVLQETMFDNLDLTIREIGVGDLGVGKKIKVMAEAFYGRMTVYQSILNSNNISKMSEALHRNLYREQAVDERVVDRMAEYALSQWEHIENQDIEDILTGKVTLIMPEVR